MGAITDTRKRLLSDLYILPDLSTSKKPKLQSRPSILNPTVERRRALHGPQRHLQSFSSRWRSKLSKLGSLVSSIVMPKSKYERLGLEEYREAVEDLTCRIVGLGFEREENVVQRKGENAKTLVAVKETTWVKKGPVYKELHELANRRDSRLSSLDSGQKLFEQRLSDIRAEQKAKEKEKEVYF